MSHTPPHTDEEPYALGPDSRPDQGVPRGDVTHFQWTSTHIYAGTSRDCWLYVPKQCDNTSPVNLMVFQDGEMYLRGDVQAPTVFDNLIHRGEMPATIGLFVNPGDKGPGSPLAGGDDNRSLEYDSLDDRYARLLLDELIPHVRDTFGLNITDDPEGRGICGFSSGGICAFTVAWQRPDAFGRVVSHCGSFADIRGGHIYPTLIRESEHRPIRVFLQSGANDLDLPCGNWPRINRDMAEALRTSGYDVRFEFGEGGHTLKHAGAIFPDTLRWLWRT